MMTFSKLYTVLAISLLTASSIFGMDKSPKDVKAQAEAPATLVHQTAGEGSAVVAQSSVASSNAVASWQAPIDGLENSGAIAWRKTVQRWNSTSVDFLSSPFLTVTTEKDQYVIDLFQW